MPAQAQQQQPANVSPASSNVMSGQNLSLYQFVVNAAQAEQAAVSASASPQAATAASNNAPKKTLFQMFFGIDLTSAMFVIVGILIVIVAMNIFFAQAAKAAAPYVVSATSTAIKAAAV